MIREIEKDDIAACYNIAYDNWGKEVAEKFLDEVSHVWLHGMKWPPQYFVFEAYHVDTGALVIAGFAGMQPSMIMNGVWDFVWVNVHKDWQGAHIGSSLTDYRIRRAKKEGASVIMLMTKEYPFFERFGFRINRVINGWAHMSLQLKELKL